MIVIIDDDPAICRSLAFALKALGHPSQSYPNPLAFLKDPVDAGLIFLDHRMPEMTGLEFIKAHPEIINSTPTILMSAYAHEIRQEALDLNIVTVLDKPFPPSVLVDLLKEHLGPTASG